MRITKGKVLKLLRALYGLNQSPRAWYEKFRKTMEAWGWRVSAYDPCVFGAEEGWKSRRLYLSALVDFDFTVRHWDGES
jgi:hypothetical protein